MEKNIRKILNPFISKNKLENDVLLGLISGFCKKLGSIEVKPQKFPFYGSTKYIHLKTDFGPSFIFFIRKEFYGRSGQTHKPDILIFEGEVPPGKRENPKPSVVIEIKGGKQTKESHREFIYEILSKSIDFLPKLSILITECESEKEEYIAQGYDGMLNYYGIQHHTIMDDHNHFEECLPKAIFNGISEEFTRKRLEKVF